MILTFIYLLANLLPLLGMLGKWVWILDLINHFRPQITCLLLFMMLVSLFQKKYHQIIFSVPMFIGCLFTIAPYFPQKLVIAAPETHLKLLYANVLTENTAYDQLTRKIPQENPDVAVFIEINQSWDQHLQTALNDFPYKKVIPREDNFGVSIFSKTPMACEVIYLTSLHVESLRCEIEWNKKQMILWATHTPPPVRKKLWTLRNEQLQALAKRVAKESKPTLVVGDLNTSPWTFWFQSFLLQSGLMDSMRGRGLQVSWPSMWPVFLRTPIDHLLHTSDIHILDRQTLEAIGSDHFPVSARMFLET